MEWQRDHFLISDDPAKLDLERVCELLGGTYWAAGRPRDLIQKSIQRSISFGLYYDRRQIGFSRMVTDEATFAWLCDVVIDPEFRGQSLGKWLVECMLAHPAAQVSQQLLRTKDAQRLYEAFGFHRQDCMTRRPTGAEAWD